MNLDGLFQSLLDHHVPWGVAVGLLFVAAMFVPALSGAVRVVRSALAKSRGEVYLGDALAIARKALAQTEACERQHQKCQEDRQRDNARFQHEINKLNSKVNVVETVLDIP